MECGMMLYGTDRLDRTGMECVKLAVTHNGMVLSGMRLELAGRKVAV